MNGDYNRELLFGNMWEEGAATPVFAINEVGKYVNLATLPMSRSVYGISFGFVGNHDYPGFYMGHWPGQGLAGAAPAFMQMTDGATLEPFDQMVNLTTSSVDQSFNFTPLFHDLNGDSYQDILIASDFGTSSVLENITSDEVADTDWRFFNNITDRDVITDENGMGSTTGDFENRGKIDWFVTSILDPDGEAEANWGVSGNRLYRNESADGAISFSDVTEQSGLRDGGWGWGACSFDFNNDGFLDIFHVNGFGYIADIADLPESETDKFEALRDRWNEITETEFQQKPPKLFINNGDGSFDDRSAEWGLTVPSEGRGLACFDYDRDGDVDIAVFDHSNRLQFFENKTGNGDGNRFLNVRLVGESPNTDALGAKVYVTADVGRQFGQQTMMRVSQANSNFNSQNLPDMHFGLGYADNIQTLSVTWPDGSELVCEDLPVNEFVVIDQRQGSGAGVCP